MRGRREKELTGLAPIAKKTACSADASEQAGRERQEADQGQQLDLANVCAVMQHAEEPERSGEGGRAAGRVAVSGREVERVTCCLVLSLYCVLCDLSVCERLVVARERRPGERSRIGRVASGER